MQNARQVGQKMELAPGSCSARQRDRTIARNWVSMECASEPDQ